MTGRELHLSVLLLEDNADDAELLLRELKKVGIKFHARHVECAEDFTAALEDEPDVILADFNVPSFGAKAALRLLRQRGLDTPLIVVTGTLNDAMARECVELGAADYLLKDRTARLGPAVVRAYIERKLRLEKDRAVGEMRRSQRHLQAVWRHSQDAMRLTDREGIIQAVNPPYCQMVGMSEEELVDRHFTVVYLEGSDQAKLRETYAQRFEEAVPVYQEETRACFQGTRKEIDVELRLTRMPVENGEDLLLTILRDISERKRMEAQFLRSQRMECIGALAGGIAHDFNNILSPMVMGVTMLRTELRPADREKTISMIEKSGQRGADICRRLLLFARGVEGEKEVIEPELLLRELTVMVEQSFPRNIELEAKVPGGLWKVKADRTQLHQVLLNLCVNARDAMPAGGSLVVEARNSVVGPDDLPPSPHAQAGRYVLVMVTDTGSGISIDDRERIFDPFFSTKAADGGTGLGLSTSLSIIQSHGGFITVQSEEGQGTCFSIYLPVSEGETAEVESPVVGSQTGGRGEVILVVDDEPAVGELIGRVLGRSGYRTILAGNGAQALECLAAANGDIGLIVTDLSMPKMGGLELLRKVRETRSDLPAIAMSGNADQALVDALKEAGVTEVIQKPFQADHLLRAIQTTLGA